jgi:Domain of unknown function (DUF5680)
MDGLIKFIVEAKKSSYATQGDTQSVTPLLPGTKQLEYSSGNYFYRDIYVGMLNFAGQEIVCLKEKPIWSMSYAGGLLPVADKSQVMNIYSVLREALRLICAGSPFRGPKNYSNAPYSYTNITSGTLNHFNGHELIFHNQVSVYELFYSGGMIV